MIIVNKHIVSIEHFPDGTQRLNVEQVNPNYNKIVWKYEKEEELSTLIFVTKHLRENTRGQVVLMMPYLPNARMDRVKNFEEVFTLKYFTDVINWLNFDEVQILDVHSNVGIALLNRAYSNSAKVSIEKAINKICYERGDGERLILYFPDEGAAKRYSDMFPNLKYCYGEKKRDWSTGKILGLEVKTNGINIADKPILMIDDIIAYGGSLHYSAKALKDLGVSSIYAYATHTENSILDREKGTLIKDLEDNTVEKLYTTDSLFTGNHEKIEVMEVM